MKKALFAISFVTVISIMVNCSPKKETVPPAPKKYEYKRTPGEVIKIEGDIFVDTGGTVFTVKGKGFDPSRKKYYHLLLDHKCNNTKYLDKLNGYITTGYYSDTASIINITDSTIKFQIKEKNIYTVRYNPSGGSCAIKDSVGIIFAVTSKDSSNSKQIVTQFEILKEKKVKNKLFFSILKDTLIWHTKRSINIDELAVTLHDVVPSERYGDQVKLYFNDILLNTTNNRDYCAVEILEGSSLIGDSYFLFNETFYKDNINLGLNDGEYTITMKERRTGLAIEEKRGKKKVYVKFVD